MPEPSSASRRPNFPDWALLNTIAHDGSLSNATTAAATTSALFPIEVSFEVVDLPGLSRCVVNCPEIEMKPDEFRIPTRVTGADGAFLLIRASFPARRRDRAMHSDVFVYRAGPGTPPSLRLIPRPYPTSLYSTHVGLLSCGNGRHCLVVVPEPRLDNLDRMVGYDLHVFSTETNSWTTRAARLDSNLQGYSWPGISMSFMHQPTNRHVFSTETMPWTTRPSQVASNRHQPTKVFSVGGDSLAWVDMTLGVLFCNVLVQDPEMQLIDLPPLMPTNKEHLGGGIVGPTPYLPAARDVICKDGWISCIETAFPELSEINPEFRWTAIVSKRRMFSSDTWETAVTVDSASISPAGSCFPDLFPDIWDSKGSLTLNNVISTTPMLDACHDNVVYMKSKLHPCFPNGWVLAVDTKDKKLLRAVPFSAEKLYFDHTYLQSGFAKYISKAPGVFTTTCSHAVELIQ